MLSQNVILDEDIPVTGAKTWLGPRASTVSTVSTLCSDVEEDKSTSFEHESRLEDIATRFTRLLCSNTHTEQKLAPILMRGIKVLMSCGYDYLDVSSVLAVTVEHHSSLLSRLTKTTLSDKERSFIILAQMFIAHTIVLDECVVLSNWHKYLFSSYCDMNCLKRAIARILKRMEYTLTVEPDRVSDLAHSILNFS